MNTVGQQESEPDVARHEVKSTNMDQHEEQITADQLIVSDIGIIDRNNSAQMHSFLKIAVFEIPSNIPKDANNHAFPYRLINKILSNGEMCKRDWMCYSMEKQSLYCAPCFLLNNNTPNVSTLSDSTGWNISRGWRKLKDRIPSHENSTFHKENYVIWKSANKAALSETSVDNLLLAELKTETEYWKKLLERILNIILFCLNVV